jgi:hypothetical protein
VDVLRPPPISNDEAALPLPLPFRAPATQSADFVERQAEIGEDDDDGAA